MYSIISTSGSIFLADLVLSMGYCKDTKDLGNESTPYLVSTSLYNFHMPFYNLSCILSTLRHDSNLDLLISNTSLLCLCRLNKWKIVI